MHWPGVEPGSTAWKAAMLTVTPPMLSCGTLREVSLLFPVVLSWPTPANCLRRHTCTQMASYTQTFKTFMKFNECTSQVNLFVFCSVLYVIADEGLHDQNVQSNKVLMLCQAQ